MTDGRLDDDDDDDDDLSRQVEFKIHPPSTDSLRGDSTSTST